MRLWSWLLVLPAVLVACGDKAAVSLTATMPEAQVSVEEGVFGAALAGSFRIELALGNEASGSTSVSIGNFSLQTEAGASLVDVLKPETDTPFPVQLDKGELKSVSFKLREEGVDRDALCAGKLRIVGSVMDSLKGATDPIRSPLITPSCDAT